MLNEKIQCTLLSMEDLVDCGCIDVLDTISVIEQSLLNYKKGKILLPSKISQIFNEDTQDRINCMPATLFDEKISGIKWVSVFPNNPIKYGISNVNGLIVLSEIEKGHPIAIMDGTFITAFRTACVGAIASKYLAKKQSKTIGIIGSGEQAKMHLLAIANVHPEIEYCKVASRNPTNELRFVKEMKKLLPHLKIEVCNSDYDLAAEKSDIVVTAVSCQLPLLKARAISAGTLYIHVAGLEDEYEVALKADKIICDDWESVKHRSQTISQLYKQGRLNDDDIYSNLVDIIDDTKKGRENDSEFIYFNSVGLSFIDISVAYHYYLKSQSASNHQSFYVKCNNPIGYYSESLLARKYF